MKNLKDILEKLSIDDIIDSKEFPIDGTIRDMIEFLKEEGFEEAANLSGNLMSTILNKKRNKCFIISDTSIWFADTSKGDISKDNPIFLIEKRVSLHFSVYIPSNVIVEDNKKAFLEELNKQFGWQ